MTNRSKLSTASYGAVTPLIRFQNVTNCPFFVGVIFATRKITRLLFTTKVWAPYSWLSASCAIWVQVKPNGSYICFCTTIRSRCLQPNKTVSSKNNTPECVIPYLQHYTTKSTVSFNKLQGQAA